MAGLQHHTIINKNCYHSINEFNRVWSKNHLRAISPIWVISFLTLRPLLPSLSRNSRNYFFILTYPYGRILPLFSISVLYFRLDCGCKNYYFLNLGPECRLKGWKMCSGWVRLFRGHSMLLEWESLQGKKGQHNLEMKSSTNTVDLDWHKKGSQHCSRCLFCCCPWNYNMEKKSGGVFERHPLFISSFFPYCFFLKII